ncbi:acyl-CoA dehydrogenase family protein [Nonomuraea bangladeshensis]|uniref:acyl-CoA dehydrogenase family protein n=1 Tax=Nonomuraea bangladeshensis TaxID=404385 RepID=UPI003C2E5AF0
MDFTFTDDQLALREVTREFLAKHGEPARRTALAEPGGFDRALWRRLTGELGLAGLAVPERFGGAGAGLLEIAIVVEELGASLLPMPYLPSALAAALLAELADGESAAPAARPAAASAAEFAAEQLPGLADGTLIGALACAEVAAGQPPGVRLDAGGRLHGTTAHVLGGDVADVLLVAAATSDGVAPGGARRDAPGVAPDGVRRDAPGVAPDGARRDAPGVALYGVRRDAPGLAVSTPPPLDPTRPQALITFTGTPAVPLAADERRAVELLWTALAVESAGAARRCLTDTVDHLRTRTQFGRPLGSFQALKHRCADLAAEIESAVSTAYYAVWAAAESPRESAVVAPLAKAHCADVFFHAAAESIQLHGGIGFTWEHDAHLYLKRAKSTQLLYGSPSYLRRVVGRRALILD